MNNLNLLANSAPQLEISFQKRDPWLHNKNGNPRAFTKENELQGRNL